ncbi:MAG TPA: hypothetical protein VHL58_18275 [Thermoanaerobaculia bacterium]|nr:hypothetical protein [Thermoanaerobaculia bacterium]
MADLEQMLKEIFGESFNKLTQFQADQIKKITDRVHEMAKDAVREDIGRLATELLELRSRVATLEAERVRGAAEGLGSSF